MTMLSDEQLLDAYMNGGGWIYDEQPEKAIAGLRAVEAAVRADQIEKDEGIAEKAADESPYDFQDHSAEIIAAIRAQLDGESGDE